MFCLRRSHPVLLDLNYRIDLPDSDIRGLLSDEAVDNVPLLLRYDQVLSPPSSAKSSNLTHSTLSSEPQCVPTRHLPISSNIRCPICRWYPPLNSSLIVSTLTEFITSSYRYNSAALADNLGYDLK